MGQGRPVPLCIMLFWPEQKCGEYAKRWTTRRPHAQRGCQESRAGWRAVVLSRQAAQWKYALNSIDSTVTASLGELPIPTRVLGLWRAPSSYEVVPKMEVTKGHGWNQERGLSHSHEAASWNSVLACGCWKRVVMWTYVHRWEYCHYM